MSPTQPVATRWPAGLVRQRFPADRELPAARLVAEVEATPADGALRPGDERVLDFFADVGIRLTRRDVTRHHPELAPLGYFLRRASLRRLLATLADPPGQVSVPRGLVFHVPPANVPALFVYPWALAALAGNPSIVRLPTTDSPTRDLLLAQLVAAAGLTGPAVASTQRIVSFGHDDTVTGVLSAACRIRALWGSDQTVTALRRVPVPLGTRELVFPERASLAAIAADAWLSAPSRHRSELVGRLYTDSYWYGQAACASPLTLCLVGGPEEAETAGRELVRALAACVSEHQSTVDPVLAVEQRVHTYGLAAEGVAVGLHYPGAGLATVEPAPGRLLDRWAGTGTFGLVRLRRLLDLAPLLGRRHQTLSHFGFPGAELTELVRHLGGNALDRVVPIGEALAFEQLWDGYDLLREFTRPVVVRADSRMAMDGAGIDDG